MGTKVYAHTQIVSKLAGLGLEQVLSAHWTDVFSPIKIVHQEQFQQEVSCWGRRQQAVLLPTKVYCWKKCHQKKEQQVRQLDAKQDVGVAWISIPK